MDIVRAIEDNAAELLMAMGAAGGGSQRADDRAEWTIGGSPIDYHNAVVRASDVAVVAESLAELKKHGVPGTWHAGPSMPVDRSELRAALTAAGFVSGGSEPGMAVRIADLRAPRAVPGLTITRVGDDDALAVWEATLGQGFGEGEREARWVASVYRKLGYGDPWRHYVGWLDGTPVATATVFLGAGVAGVYFVMTVPEARRRGIGAAITYGALRATAPNTGNDAYSGAASDARSGAANDAHSGAGSDTHSGPGSDAQPGAGSDADAQSDTQPGAGSDTHTGPGSDTHSGPGPDTRSHAQSDADAQSDTRSGADVRSGSGAGNGAAVEYAVLGSSPAGRSVYEGLGFREYCTIELYEWAG
ncbi:GNAT family N-acetyltransferase [Kribbella shirazensis]|uniref:GNAT superfamily N-acetyltransferase n=1 Tax=Kribbella shirazensis TaxID=1105143 RepID=A0A7X5VB37_9ACTN|nr:GNAT family N-acetyltransferase [Kribbella shirazensis]NIK57262.1 GNAT superfamily N-acetyltransferase [Kribbella shirazensis]